MTDEWKEFTGSDAAAATAAAAGHYAVSEDALEVHVVPASLRVAGLGARVLVLATPKEVAPEDLSDLGEFAYTVLEKLGWAGGLRIREQEDGPDVVLRLSGMGLENALRREREAGGALAHLIERAGERFLEEDASVRVELPQVSDRGPRRERESGGSERRGRRNGREGRGGRGAGERERDGGRRRGAGNRDDSRLERLALDTAEEVKRSGEPRVLEPMSSRDRWVVHNAVKQVDGVTSQSVTQDGEKCVKLLVGEDRH